MEDNRIVLQSLEVFIECECGNRFEAIITDEEESTVSCSCGKEHIILLDNLEW